MGLFTGLVTLPLAPVRGVVWVARRIEDAADREVNDPAVIRRELAALQRDLADGVIDEETYDRYEDELLDRLEQTHPTVGAPLPMSGPRAGEEPGR